MRYLLLFFSLLFMGQPTGINTSRDFNEVLITCGGGMDIRGPVTVLFSKNDVIAGIRYRTPQIELFSHSLCKLSLPVSLMGKVPDSIRRAIFALDPTKLTKSREELVNNNMIIDDYGVSFSFLKNKKVIYEVRGESFQYRSYLSLDQLSYSLYNIRAALPPNYSLAYNLCPILKEVLIYSDENKGSPLLLRSNENFLLAHFLRESQQVDTLITQGYRIEGFEQDSIPGKNWQLIDSLKTDGRYWTFYHRDSSAATLDMGVNFLTYTLANHFEEWQEVLKKTPKSFFR